MKRITVFCGSSSGNQPIYDEQARALGAYMALQGIGLVYGGAKVGLMGAVADAVLEKGGEVTGVIPGFLQSKEIAHENLTELILTETMHERKMKMHDLSDGAIALPGGFGTLEELFEILTWGQLGLHQKPVAILNVGGYFDDLIRLIEKMVQEGFLRASNQEMLLVDANIENLIEKMHSYQAPATPKWISKGQV